MMTLIIGGSGSGKSEFAENYIMRQAKESQKYYIATMQIYDEEGHRKVLRHQKLREGKGLVVLNGRRKKEKMEDYLESFNNRSSPMEP